jgi:hypothetical protein
MFPFGCMRDGRVKMTVSCTQTDYKVLGRREVRSCCSPPQKLYCYKASLSLPIIISEFLLKKLSPFHKTISTPFQFMFFHQARETEQAQLH